MKQRRVKEFFSFFWIKFGSWKSLKDYSYVLVSFGTRRIPRYGNIGTFQIFLVPLDKNKTPSILLKYIGEEKKAVRKAEEYSAAMDFPFKSNIKR